MTPKFYVVGGAVRDALMGIEPSDIDYLVVGATPEWMIANGFTQVGADFPVFLKAGEEYALARTERKTGAGYHGFTTNWATDVTLEDDLRRRDLTINSLAVELERWPEFLRVLKQLPTHVCAAQYVIGSGYDDIKTSMIRANDQAFSEDPVRVLRAIRFANTMSGGIWQYDVDTYACMANMAASEDFTTLTDERVVQELMKTAKKTTFVGFMRFLSDLRNLGVLKVVLDDKFKPPKSKLFGTQPNDRFGPVVGPNGGTAALMLGWTGDVNDCAKLLKSKRFTTDDVEFGRCVVNLKNQFGYEAVKQQPTTPEDVFQFVKTSKFNYIKQAVEFSATMNLIDPNNYTSLMYAVERVWPCVGFDDLTEHQQQTLQGRAIAEAIDAVKLARLKLYYEITAFNRTTNVTRDSNIGWQVSHTE